MGSHGAKYIEEGEREGGREGVKLDSQCSAGGCVALRCIDLRCFADVRSQYLRVASINTEAVRHRSIELIITAIMMIEVSSPESSTKSEAAVEGIVVVTQKFWRQFCSHHFFLEYRKISERKKWVCSIYTVLPASIEAPKWQGVCLNHTKTHFSYLLFQNALSTYASILLMPIEHYKDLLTIPGTL